MNVFLFEEFESDDVLVKCQNFLYSSLIFSNKYRTEGVEVVLAGPSRGLIQSGPVHCRPRQGKVNGKRVKCKALPLPYLYPLTYP